MKKKTLATLIIAIVLVLLLSGGAFLVVYEVYQNKQATKTEEPKYDYETFAEYTTESIFESIPALIVEGGKIGAAEELGKGSYTLNVSGTTMDDYKAYLADLEDKGFKKHSDNGEEGMEGYVYTASFTKDDLVLNVYHIAKYEATYINASKGTALSDHLVYQDSYMEGAAPDAKTKLHMIELNDNGNSFVIQLKNGHFIVEDGGIESDAPYLLDYLEELTPGDEKPVIEAWFMTHAHGDHYGAIKKIMSDVSYTNRIYVEGVYFVDPSNKVLETQMANESAGTSIWFVMNASNTFKRQDGSKSVLYRPSLGQRYYFADMTIDITLTVDQFVNDSWQAADFNDTSTWLMHNIEGQKFLHAGDAAETGAKYAMDFYDKKYFDLDIFAVLHHGINVYNYFTDYCKVKTLLYTSRNVGSLYTATWAARKEENAYLQAAVEESLSHGNGTVVLTFPYKVGTSETMKPCDWRYTNGKRDGRIWDVINGRKE